MRVYQFRPSGVRYEYSHWIQQSRQLRRIVARPGLRKSDNLIDRGLPVPVGLRWPYRGGMAYYRQHMRSRLGR